MYFTALSIAPVVAQESRQVRVTHPFHPLSGRQFDLIEHRAIFAEHIVYFHDDFGDVREVPAAWTDFMAPDPFIEIAAGQSPLHAGRLLELATLLQSSMDAAEESVK